MLTTRIIFNLNALLRVACCGLFTLMLSVSSHADSQRYLDYQYDAAGNIISIRASRNLAPPSVTNISPSVIPKEKFVTVNMTGLNLTKVAVNIPASGVIVSHVSQVSETEIDVTIYASANALTGTIPIVFTNTFGTDNNTVTITESIYAISSLPSPIALAPNTVEPVTLIFDQTFLTDQVYDVKLSNTAIATLANSQITLLAGESTTIVNVSAQNIGGASLEITQGITSFIQNLPIFVQADKLPIGNYLGISRPVGIVASIEQPGSTSVGSLTASSFVSPVIGLTAQILQPELSAESDIVSSSIGVVAHIEQAGSSSQGSFVSNSTGVIFDGLVITQVLPALIEQSGNATLTIIGQGLNAVTAISILPPDDFGELPPIPGAPAITQNGPLIISPDGSQITVPIDVPNNLLSGIYRIVVTTADGERMLSNAVFELSLPDSRV